jgi:exopolysaccharide production protein ExoQ
MPPGIALISSLIFSLILFWRDSRKQSRSSVALWIPTIWVMLIGSRFASLWIHANINLGPIDPFSEGSPIDRIVFSSLILLGILSLAGRSEKVRVATRENGAIYLFTIYCAVSVLWSDYSIIAFKRWVKEVGHIVMIVVILTETDPRAAIKTVLRRLGYLMIPLSIVLIKYYPDMGRMFSPWTGQGMNIGVATSKNMLGTLCLVTGIYFFIDMMETWNSKRVESWAYRSTVNLIFLGMIFWLLKGLNSVTSLICLIIGLTVYWIMGKDFVRSNIKILGIVILFFVVGGLAVANLSDFVGDAIVLFGRDATLTNRVPIWKNLINIATSPLLGTGYGSFWLGERAAIIREEWNAGIAHNGYLEIYLNLGWIGLLFVGGILVKAYRKNIIEAGIDYGYGKFKIVFYFVVIVYNFTESGLNGMSLIWFVFLLLSFGPAGLGSNIHGKMNKGLESWGRMA